MKTIWNRITLMEYATDEDDGKIPLEAWIGTGGVAALIWSVWTIAQWIVQN